MNIARLFSYTREVERQRDELAQQAKSFNSERMALLDRVLLKHNVTPLQTVEEKPEEAVDTFTPKSPWADAREEWEREDDEAMRRFAPELPEDRRLEIAEKARDLR